MMHKTIHALSWGLAAALTVAVAQAQPANWAESLFEKLSHDFGVVAKGADVKHHLKLANRFPNPVHISSAGTQCKCATARVSQDTLAPGETGYIEIALDTKKFDRTRDTAILVTFDRPQFAEVRIPIKAYIRTDVVFTPGAAEFGSVARGTSADRQLSIAYAGRPDWTIKNVINKNGHLDVRFRETGRSGINVTYELTVTLKSSAPFGELRDHVTLVTDDPANPFIPVLVEARVEDEYSVATELVDFGTLTPGTRKTVNVVVRGRKPFTIEKIESETTARVFEVRLPKEPRTIQVLPMTIIAPSAPGTIREEFTISIAGGAGQVLFKAQCRIVPSTAARP